MKYRLLFFLALYSVLCSCNEGSATSGLAGDCPNPINLSKKELSFSASGGTDNVIIDGNWWLEVSEYGNEEEYKLIGAYNNPDYCENNYCKSNWIMKIESSWFSVTQTDDNTLLVSVNSNETEKTRRQTIGGQAGNCFSEFFINQSAE